MEFWLLYIGLLVQFVGVFITGAVEFRNFEWILERMKSGNFGMVKTDEMKKIKRRELLALAGFTLIFGGIALEILNAVSDFLPTLSHSNLVVIHAYNIILQEHVGLTDTIFTKH